MKNLYKISYQILLILKLIFIDQICAGYFDTYKNTEVNSNVAPVLTFNFLNKKQCLSLAGKYCPFGIVNYYDGKNVGINAFSIQIMESTVKCSFYANVFLNQITISNATNLYLRNSKGYFYFFN